MTLSVLLIIGAAVVGPIDGHLNEYEAVVPSGFSKCTTTGPEAPDRPYCEKRLKAAAETLPQLCERAMQEIGATRRGFGPLKGAWIIDNGIVAGGLAVTCIPTPEGYRQ